VLRDPDGRQRDSVTVCDADPIRREYADAWVRQTIRLVTGPRSDRVNPPCVDIPTVQLRRASSLLPSHLLTPVANTDERLSRARQARGAAINTTQISITYVLDLLNGITFRPSNTDTRHLTVGELLRGGQLVHLRGHRIAPAVIGRTGQCVLGREELLDQVPIGRRRVDLMSLAGFNAAGVTEPGDVILLADDELRVIVDEDGGSVLLFPAQGLRIPAVRKHLSTFLDEPQKPWIRPYALAALLRADRNSTRTGGSLVRRAGLHQIQLPHLAERDLDILDEALYQLHEATQQARDRAAALERLQARIGDGIADGAFTLEHLNRTHDEGANRATAYP